MKILTKVRRAVTLLTAAALTAGALVVAPATTYAQTTGASTTANIATSYNVTWEVPDGTPTEYDIYTPVSEGTYKARLTDTTGQPLPQGTQVYATWPTIWDLYDPSVSSDYYADKEALLKTCDRYIWDPTDTQHRECYGYNDLGAFPRSLVTVGENGYVTFPAFQVSNDWKTLFQFYASGTQGTQDMIGDPVRFTVIPGDPFPESAYLLKEASEYSAVGQTFVYTTDEKTTDQYEEQTFYAIPHDRYWNNYHGKDYKGLDLGKYVYVSNSVGIPENAGPYFSIQRRNWAAISGSVKPVGDVPAGFEWIEYPKWVPERGAFEGKFRAKWPGERQTPNTAPGGEGPADEGLYFWMNMAPWGQPDKYRLLGAVGTRKKISAPREVTVKLNKAGTEAKYDKMVVAGYLRKGDKLYVNGNESATAGKQRGAACPSKAAIPTTQVVSNFTLENDVAYPGTPDLARELPADQLKLEDTYRKNIVTRFSGAKLCATLIDNEYWTSNGMPLHKPALENNELVPADPEYRDQIEYARISKRLNVNIEWEPLDKPLSMTGTKNSANQTGSVTVVVPPGTPKNAEVVLFNNAGVEIARQTIAEEGAQSSGGEVTFDFGGSATLAFASVTDTVQAYIAQNITADGVTIGITLPKGTKDKRFTEKVTYSFFAPVVTSATRDIKGNIEISGTTPANTEVGTEISIKNAAGVVIGTAKVQADGTWSLSTTAEQIGTNAPAANTNVSAAMGPATGPGFTVVPKPVPVSDVVAVRNPATGVTSITATADAPAGTPVSISLPDGSTLTGEVGAEGKIGPLTTNQFNAGAAVTVTVSDGTYTGSASGTVTEQAVPAQTPTPTITSAVVGADGGLTVTGTVAGVAEGTPVVIKDADGHELGTAHTDASGHFTVTKSASELGTNAPERADQITAVATEEGKEPSKPGTGTVVEELPTPTKVEGVRSADGETVTVSVTVDPNTPAGSVVQVLDPSDPSKVLGFATYPGEGKPVTVELTGDAADKFPKGTQVPVQVAPGDGATNTVSSTATEGGINNQTPTPTNVTVTVLPDGSVVVAGEVPGAADGTTVDVTLPNGEVIKDVPVTGGKFDNSASPFKPTSPVEPGGEASAVATDGEKAPSAEGTGTVVKQLPASTKVEGVRSADGDTVTVSVTVDPKTPAGSVVQVLDPSDPTKVLGFATYPGDGKPVTVELTGDAATALDGVSEVPVRVAPGEGAANTVASEPADGTVKDQTPTPTNVTVTVLPDGSVVVAGEVSGTVGTTTVDITLPSGDVIEDVPVKDGKFDTSDKPITPKSAIESGASGVTAVATEEGKAPSEPAGGLVNGKLPAPTKVEGTRSADGKTVIVNVTVAEGTPAGSVVQVLAPSDPTKVIGTGTYTGGSDPVTVELTGEPAIAFAGKTQVPVQVAPGEGATNTVSSTATKGDIKNQTPTPTNVSVTVLPDGTVVVAGEVPGAADGTTVNVTLPNGDVIEDVPVTGGKFDTSATPFTPSSEVEPGGEATAVATEDGKVPSEVGTSTVVKQLPAPTKVEGTRSPDSKTVTVKVSVDPGTPEGSLVQVLDPVTGDVLEEITYTGGTDPVTITLTSTDAAKFAEVSEVPVRVAPDANTKNTVPSASTEGTVAGPVARATLTTDKNFAKGPVVAGTDVEFTYTPVDANGNVVDMGETIDLTIPGSTQPLKLQRQTDGTYKGTTKLTTATPNNGAEADQATVIVTGQPNANARTDVKVKADVAKNVTATVTSDYAAYGVREEDPTDFGDPATVTYTVTDDYGNPADLPAGTTITATGTSAAGESKVDDPTRTKLGTYTQKVQLQISGPRPQDSSEAVRTLTLTPTVDGLTVTPVELHYTSPPVNTKPEYSNYTVEPVATGTDTTVYANGTDKYKITVKLGAHDDHDPKRWDDQVIKGRAPALSVTGLREGDTVTSFDDNGDGTYTAYVTSTVPGAPKLVVNVSDSELTATDGSVTPEFADQVIDPTKSEFTSSASEVTPGEQVTFTYTPKDPHGQPIPATSPVLKDREFITSPLADGTTVALTPTAAGTFAGLYTPQAPAALTNVTPQEGGKDVGPAAPLKVTPGAFSATKSALTFLDQNGKPLAEPVVAGSDLTLKFVPQDENGYPLSGKVNDAGTVSVTVPGQAAQVVLTWSEKGQAYVSAPFKQTVAGPLTATGLGAIAGATATAQVDPAAPDQVVWTGTNAADFTAGAMNVTAGESVDLPAAQVVDQFGNPVKAGTQIVVTAPDGQIATVAVGAAGSLPLGAALTLPGATGATTLTLVSGDKELDQITFTAATGPVNTDLGSLHPSTAQISGGQLLANGKDSYTVTVELMDKAGNPVSGLADQLQLTGAPALGSGLGEVKFTEDPDRPGTYTAQVTSTSIASGSDLQVQVAGQNVGSPLAYDFIDGTTGAVTITAAQIGPDGAVTITGTAAAPAGSAVEITLPNGTKLTGTVADAAGNFELTGTAQQAAGLKAGDPLTVQVMEENKLPAQASGQFIKLLPAPAVTASVDVPGNLTATVTVPADTPAGTIIVLSDGQGTSLGTATFAGDGQPVVISVPAPAGAGVTTVTANLLVPADSFTRAPAAGTGPVATPDRTATPVVDAAVVTPDGLLTVTGNVPGTKAGEPVTITLPDGQQLTSTIADDQGNFVLTGMPQTPLKPGAQLSVTATATGLYPATPAQVPVAFSQFTPPTNIQAVLNPDSGSTTFTAAAAAADGTPATITLPDGSTITAQVQGGKIVAADGQPLVIPGLHAGEQLQVSLGTGAAASPAATGTVTVANMQPPVVTDIVRDPATGNVTITGYLPGAGAGVTVQAVNPDTNEVIGTDTTDEDGAFEILVPADLAEGISDFTVRAADRQTTATKDAPAAPTTPRGQGSTANNQLKCVATSSTIPGKLLGAAILIGAAVGIINWVKDTIVLPDLVGPLLAQNPGLGGLQDQLPQLPQVQLPGVELPALPVVDLSPLAPVGIGIGLLALLGWSYSSCQDAA